VSDSTAAALAVHIRINTTLTGATGDIDGGQQVMSILIHCVSPN